MLKGKNIFFVCLIFLLVSYNSHAKEPVVIIASGEYVMGSGESMEIAYEKAIKAAEQIAAEQAGVFVKSNTKVKNFTLENDVVETIANHSMKVEVLEKKKTVVGELDAIKFYVKIKATMSQEDIESNLKKVMQDQSIVEDYNRLKANNKKLNNEMEKLKRQLELATGGDKQKIAKLISEEEKKYKANLWLERAQKINFLNSEEKLKAYEKALELNSDMPQAYFGIAKVIMDTTLDVPTNDKDRESKLNALRDALEHLNRAIALDENYSEAYALRVEILYKIKWLENIGENGKEYDTSILKDIDRAIALNVPNKRELYYFRAYIYLDELQNTELEQNQKGEFNPEIIEGYLNKAIDEIDVAGSLCKEKDLTCLADYYLKKANAYSIVRNYYARLDDRVKSDEYNSLRNKFAQKAQEMEMQERERRKEEEAQFDEEFSQTEYRKIEFQLIDEGWKERATGISIKEIQQKTEKEQEEIGKKIEAKVRQKIATGMANALEYIFISRIDENPQKRKSYLKKGLALLERNPYGIDGLLLVKFYLDIDELDKAKSVVSKNLPEAQTALSLEEFIQLSSQMANIKSNTDSLNVMKKLSKLNKQQAEAFFWLSFAERIAIHKAEMYEKLDLLKKAIEEYLYLCKNFKDEDACKNAERLKK